MSKGGPSRRYHLELCKLTAGVTRWSNYLGLDLVNLGCFEVQYAIYVNLASTCKPWVVSGQETIPKLKWPYLALSPFRRKERKKEDYLSLVLFCLVLEE